MNASAWPAKVRSPEFDIDDAMRVGKVTLDEDEYTADLLIAAHPVVRMGTRAHKKNNLRSMKISARLIPDAPSLNWTRGWKTNQFTNVRPDADNYKQLGVFTDYQSRTAHDWNVEVKLRWVRAGKIDWKRQLLWKFDENICGGIPGGS